MPSDEVATNNKAELRAAIKAVEIACENGVNRLMINSDSKFVVMGITQWILKWTKNNWKMLAGNQ